MPLVLIVVVGVVVGVGDSILNAGLSSEGCR
jgi:hypothetical protein